MSRPIGFMPEVNRELERISEERRSTVPEVVREAVDEMLRPKSNTDDPDTEQFRAKFLDTVPCGPWDEAVDQAGEIVVDAFVADELEARDDDVWVRADGDSMKECGILNGFLVLTRPYDGKRPRTSEIVVAQALKENGEYVSTIKTFVGTESNGAPRLEDGKGNSHSLPDDTLKVDIVARAIGVIGRL